MKLEKSKLVLGSAQWGMHYGVKNNRSQTSSTRVGEILDYAYQSGVNLIDTARSYGDAEDKIGKLGSSFFNVITKLQPLGISVQHLICSHLWKIHLILVWHH